MPWGMLLTIPILQIRKPRHRDIKQLSQGHTVSQYEARLQLLVAILLTNKLYSYMVLEREDHVLFIFVCPHLGNQCPIRSRHLQNMCKTEYFWALECPSFYFISLHFTKFSSLQPNPHLVPFYLGKSSSLISPIQSSIDTSLKYSFKLFTSFPCSKITMDPHYFWTLASGIPGSLFFVIASLHSYLPQPCPCIQYAKLYYSVLS